jgi:hypothetical protein
VLQAVLRKPRLRCEHPLRGRAVNREHVVLLRLDPPEVDQLAQLLRMLSGEIVAIDRVRSDVEQLPPVGVESFQVGRDTLRWEREVRADWVGARIFCATGIRGRPRELPRLARQARLRHALQRAPACLGTDRLPGQFPACSLSREFELENGPEEHAARFCIVAHAAVSIRLLLFAGSGSRAGVTASGVTGHVRR